MLFQGQIVSYNRLSISKREVGLRLKGILVKASELLAGVGNLEKLDERICLSFRKEPSMLF